MNTNGVSVRVQPTKVGVVLASIIVPYAAGILFNQIFGINPPASRIPEPMIVYVVGLSALVNCALLVAFVLMIVSYTVTIERRDAR